jgi:predicted RNA binding protein YcfA (HicA-like mRNA interferase family)
MGWTASSRVPGHNMVVGPERTLRRLLGGTAKASSRSDDLSHLLESLGSEKRVRGSHHVFRKAGVEERTNLQREGADAKPYQVKQVRAVILKYRLGDRR